LTFTPRRSNRARALTDRHPSLTPLVWKDGASIRHGVFLNDRQPPPRRSEPRGPAMIDIVRVEGG
jgi:hypothetical protein